MDSLKGAPWREIVHRLLVEDRIGEAIEYLRNRIAHVSSIEERDEARLSLSGILWRVLNRKEEALRQLEYMAHGKGSQHAEDAQIEIAMNLWIDGDREAALQAYEGFLRDYPDSFQVLPVLLHMRTICSEIGYRDKYQDATERLDAAIQQFKERGGDYERCARFPEAIRLGENGRIAEALRILRELLASLEAKSYPKRHPFREELERMIRNLESRNLKNPEGQILS